LKRITLALAVLATACGPHKLVDLPDTGGGGGTTHPSGGGSVCVEGCGGGSATGGGSASGGGASLGGGTASGGGAATGGGVQQGCEGQPMGCYTVYANGDYNLYLIDLQSKALTPVGPFNTPGGDVITDIAVAPDNTIYGVSMTTLYTISAADGHATALSDLSACGLENVGATFTPSGHMYVADFAGAFCEVDYHQSPPVIHPLGKLDNNLAVSGDMVAVDDGTLYATVYDLNDATTQDDNWLAIINPTTAQATRVGPIGVGRLFGVSYAMGHVFGFTHDGSGSVYSIDPQTGLSTLFNSYTDPSSQGPIPWAGAAVNALVAGRIQ
jgi:hypothetical protein